MALIFEGKERFNGRSEKNFFKNECFAWWLAGDRAEDLSLLRRASEMGNAYACSTLGWQISVRNKEEAFRLAQLSASKHERDGFFVLGHRFCNAAENYLIAAELGHVWAAGFCGHLLNDYDPSHWVWMGRAALRGFTDFNDFATIEASYPVQVEPKNVIRCFIQ